MFLLLFTLAINISYAKWVPGYIIWQNMDTAWIQIKVSYDNWQTVDAKDSTGHAQEYDSSVVKEYGYFYKGKQ